MTNFSFFISLLAIFNVSSGLEDRCDAREILMLPAPEDVYKSSAPVEVFMNTTVLLPPVFKALPPQKFYKNISIPYVPNIPVETYNDENFNTEEEEEEEFETLEDDVKSLRIAGFVGQCIVFLFVFTIVTMDVEQFDTVDEQDVVVHKLHKAVEIQTCPLPARQNIRIVRRLVESEC